jgi:hypothetical protein
VILSSSIVSTQGSSTVTAPGVIVVLRSGRIVIEGRRIYVSPGADFVAVFAPPWWQCLVPARFRRQPKTLRLVEGS